MKRKRKTESLFAETVTIIKSLCFEGQGVGI